MQSFSKDNPAEEVIKEFPSNMVNITPSSSAWNSRVALEIKNIMAYIEFLKKQNNALWFFLKPSTDRRFNYQKWDGYLKIPARPDIQFELRIVLTSQYPLVYPRAFAEESIKEYCAGNIYPKNIWTEPDNPKRYVMICHDHMEKTTQAWQPQFSVAHFFLREVWIWWTSKINRVILEWDKKHYNI